MESIHYRPVEKKDYDEIGEIINQAFGLYRYVPNQKLLKAFKQQYVHACLSEATYTCVAEQGGKVVGVIMGNAKKDYHLLRHLPHLLLAAFYGLKMKCCAKKGEAGIEDYKRLHEIYHTFSARHKKEFDGVLTLFAVNEECRGFGMGKTLISGLLEYLKEQQVQRIYLYTDTTCNYGFYEHVGFERLEEQMLTMTKDGQPFQMNVFLYGYTVKTR